MTPRRRRSKATTAANPLDGRIALIAEIILLLRRTMKTRFVGI